MVIKVILLLNMVYIRLLFVVYGTSDNKCLFYSIMIGTCLLDLRSLSNKNSNYFVGGLFSFVSDGSPMPSFLGLFDLVSKR